MQVFNFKKFEPFYGKLLLPPNTYLSRGHEKSDPISDKPAFFGSQETADTYGLKRAAEGRVTSTFLTSRNLVLLDLRFIVKLLADIIEHRPNNSDVLIGAFQEMVITFGIGSFKNQIDLLERFLISYNQLVEHADRLDRMKRQLRDFESRRYVNINPFEPRAERIGITNFDYNTIIYLKEIFKDVCDGFIAPELPSGFSPSGSLQEEIILFNPRDCLKGLTGVHIPPIPIELNDYIQGRFTRVVNAFNLKAHLFGGGSDCGLDERVVLGRKKTKLSRAVLESAQSFKKSYEHMILELPFVNEAKSEPNVFIAAQGV